MLKYYDGKEDGFFVHGREQMMAYRDFANDRQKGILKDVLMFLQV